MTKDDTKKILQMLGTVYISEFSRKNPDDLKNMLDVWSVLLEDEDADRIAHATKAWLKTSTNAFCPTPAMLIQKAHDIFEVKGMTELEAWGHVTRAIRNSSYHAKEEWEKLPKEVQSVCSPEQLQEWARDEHFNASVESSNFQRSFRAREKSRQEFDRLPNDTKMLIGQRVENKTEYPQIEVTMTDEEVAELSKRFAELGGL